MREMKEYEISVRFHGAVHGARYLITGKDERSALNKLINSKFAPVYSCRLKQACVINTDFIEAAWVEGENTDD